MRLKVTVAVIATVLILTAGCHKKPPKGESSDLTASPLATQEVQLREEKKKDCPDDMAWVEPAKVCIDLYEFPNISGELPLAGVTYDQAKELCKAYGKRLPTAIEWALACGGAMEFPYPYGETYKKDACWMDRAYSAGPVLSGSMPQCVSQYGIYDMTGNVWEWTETEGFVAGTKYVHGGSWLSFPSVATCTLMAWEPPEGGGKDYGFRCALKP